MDDDGVEQFGADHHLALDPHRQRVFMHHVGAHLVGWRARMAPAAAPATPPAAAPTGPPITAPAAAPPMAPGTAPSWANASAGMRRPLKATTLTEKKFLHDKLHFVESKLTTRSEA